MYRINYLPPEQMPPHERDFPPREPSELVPGADGSHALAVMVAWYLVAMFGGIVLLGHLSAPVVPPETSAVAVKGMLNK